MLQYDGVVGSEILELTASGYAVIVVVGLEISELTMHSEWCGLGSEIAELTLQVSSE